MRISNKLKNSPFSRDFLLLVAMILSILTIVTLSSSSSLSTAMPTSLLFSVAYASHGGDHLGVGNIADMARGSNNNYNQAVGGDHGGLIGNLISQQQNPQVYARNVNEDNKAIIVENCEDGKVIINDNDKIIQTNTQSFNQEANNQVGRDEEEEDDLGLIGNLISQQQNPQVYARNVNEDNKVIIVENCEDGKVIINDNDKIIQTNTQSFNQEANNQVGRDEEEEEEEKEEEDG
jgi:rRNA processing protein Gar1